METPTEHLLDSLIKAMTDDIEMLETQLRAAEKNQKRFYICKPSKRNTLKHESPLSMF
jgi:hypothetical protein